MFNNLPFLDIPFNYSNKYEFKEDLEIIHNNKHLMIREEDGKIVKAGFFTRVIEHIKGLAGSVDHTKSKWVEQRFIKMLEEGRDNNFITKEQLKGEPGSWENSMIGEIAFRHGWTDTKDLQEGSTHKRLTDLISNLYQDIVVPRHRQPVEITIYEQAISSRETRPPVRETLYETTEDEPITLRTERGSEYKAWGSAPSKEEELRVESREKRLYERQSLRRKRPVRKEEPVSTWNVEQVRNRLSEHVNNLNEDHLDALKEFKEKNENKLIEYYVTRIREAGTKELQQPFLEELSKVQDQFEQINQFLEKSSS